VRDLVRTQLGGVITMDREHGTIVRLSLPARRPGSWAR
jgi:two-component sensor histidine kinase